MCCNGVLFADVKLRRRDDAERLALLGLRLETVGAKVLSPQPCSCFDGNLCAIYADRPRLCRAFECHVLKRLNRGDLNEASARGIIAQAHRRVRVLRAVLLSLGDAKDDLPLTGRYARAMSQPIDLADPSSGRKRARLMLAMEALATVLGSEFSPRP
jgi:hypothetical protein